MPRPESFESNPIEAVNRARISARNHYHALTKVYAEMTESDPVVIFDEDTQAFRENNQLNPTSYNARNYAEEERTYVHQTRWGHIGLDAMHQTASTPLPERRLVKLTPKETLILEQLMKFPKKVHSAERLGYIASNKLISRTENPSSTGRVYIGYVRKHLGHTAETPLILTIQGAGYTMTPDTELFLNGDASPLAAN